MHVATSGPRSPINGFEETLGIIISLALNYILPSITIVAYSSPVFARLSLVPGR